MEPVAIRSCFSPDVIAMPALNSGRQQTQTQEVEGEIQILKSADMNNCKPMTRKEFMDLVENDIDFGDKVLEEYERLVLALPVYLCSDAM